ncbi:hypothetical protein [Streptomyces mirabilis]|uniref:hypothetical protein n=1 Tax=Streptomyces mirabilis TaxID=68239 RepID=UPI000ABB7C1B
MLVNMQQALGTTVPDAFTGEVLAVGFLAAVFFEGEAAAFFGLRCLVSAEFW